MQRFCVLSRLSNRVLIDSVKRRASDVIGGKNRKILIGPAAARQILVTCSNPRNEFRSQRVKEIEELMKTGKFPTPLPIRFSRSGLLVDGHHRLAAVIEAGVELEFYCEVNWPE